MYGHTDRETRTLAHSLATRLIMPGNSWGSRRWNACRSAVKIANNASHREINKESNLKRGSDDVATGQKSQPQPEHQLHWVTSSQRVASSCPGQKGNLSNGNIVWAIKQYWPKARQIQGGGVPGVTIFRRGSGTEGPSVCVCVCNHYVGFFILDLAVACIGRN